MSILFVFGIITNSAAILDCAACAILTNYFEEIRVLRACICTEHVSME